MGQCEPALGLQGLGPRRQHLIQTGHRKLSRLTLVNTTNSPAQLPSRTRTYNKGEATGNGAYMEQNKDNREKEKEGPNESGGGNTARKSKKAASMFVKHHWTIEEGAL